MGVLLACMSIHHVHEAPAKARRGTESPGTGVTGLGAMMWAQG